MLEENNENPEGRWGLQFWNFAGIEGGGGRPSLLGNQEEEAIDYY